MQLQIAKPKPAPLADGVAPLRKFDAVRAHIATQGVAVVALQGATLAIGAHLNALYAAEERQHGGDRATTTALAKSWKQTVTEQTGKSPEYCRRCRLAADAVLEDVKGKRSEDARRVRALLTDPDGQKWTFEDYELLSAYVGARWDVSSWTELLRELGIIRKAISNPTGATGDRSKPLPITEQAQSVARRIVGTLIPQNREERRKLLASLEVNAASDEELDLTDIKHALMKEMEEVEDVIARKLN